MKSGLYYEIKEHFKPNRPGFPTQRLQAMPIDENPAGKSGIQVLDRAVRLLDALALPSSDPVALKRLALDTGLHPSSAFRILAALGRHGLVRREARGYRLGPKLLHLAGRARTDGDLREAARPILESLRDAVQETVNLTVREGDEVVYVERAVARKMVRVEQVIGHRAPLHVTAVGKLFLADGTLEAMSRYVDTSGLPAFTRRTITDGERLRRECQLIRKRGYASDAGEAEDGVCCLAVPIRDHAGALVAALSVSAPGARPEASWLPKLRAAGRQLSERLGHQTG
jgi:DNA-binding IclR family transcriptional regulator